jgi:hypothetical protein
MKSQASNVIQIVFGLVTLAVLGWGAYLIVAAIGGGLVRMRSDVAVAVVAASATATVSVVTMVLSKRFEARAAVLQDLRTRKIPIYEEVIATLFRIQNADKLGEKPLSPLELMRFLAKTTEQIVIWGSDDVVKELRAFRASSLAHSEGAHAPMTALFRYESLLLAIRRDLGHKNSGFKPGTLLGLWINDIDKFL